VNRAEKSTCAILATNRFSGQFYGALAAALGFFQPPADAIFQ
jgi:hypothetical protein